MTGNPLVRKVALAAALVSAISVTGVTLAATPPRSTHASSTAVTQVAANESDTDTDSGSGDGQDAHALAVSTAAASDLTGGAHNNHGGYVSCVARGGSDCTSVTPTLPSHGESTSHPGPNSHSH